MPEKQDSGFITLKLGLPDFVRSVSGRNPMAYTSLSRRKSWLSAGAPGVTVNCSLVQAPKSVIERPRICPSTTAPFFCTYACGGDVATNARGGSPTSSRPCDPSHARGDVCIRRAKKKREEDEP